MTLLKAFMKALGVVAVLGGTVCVFAAMCYGLYLLLGVWVLHGLPIIIVIILLTHSFYTEND